MRSPPIRPRRRGARCGRAREAPLLRLRVEPDDSNGLQEACSLMVDKISTVPRRKLGQRIGRLGDEEMVRLGRAALVFLGFAG
ncbi:MAG TPA: type II toxin-antitoxin system PemK/MazF family toxin [Acidimicrobiales bacterium]